MRRALIASLAIHLSMGAVLTFALARPRPLPVEEIVAVELVAAPETGPTAKATAAPAEAAPLPPREAAAPAPVPAPEPPAEVPPPEKPPAKTVQPPPAPSPAKPAEPKIAAPPARPEPPRAKPAPPKEVEPPPRPPEKPPVEKPKAKPVEPPRPAQAASKPPPEPSRATPQPAKPLAEDSFAALLRSVEKLDRRVQAERASPGKGRAEPQPQEARGEAARAEATLTQGEVDAIRRQIERCWNVPVGVRGIETMQVRLRIAMNRDGSVARVGIEDQARMTVDPAFRTVAESAQRAILTCQLVLPAEKYEQWREMVMTFHPKDALSG